MSTRMDDAVIRYIGMLAKRFGTSKKAVLENAVSHYAEKIDAEKEIDVFHIHLEAGSGMNRQQRP